MLFPPKLAKRVRIKKGPILLGHPIVEPGALYVGGGSYPIYRVDTEELKVAWSREYLSCRPGCVLGRRLIIGNGANQLKALDSETGDAVWSHSSAGGSVWRDQILTFESDCIGLLDLQTGKLNGRIVFPGILVRALKGDTALYSKDEVPRRSGAYDLAKQEILWERSLLEETITQHGAPGDFMTLAVGFRAVVLTKPNVGIFGCSLEDGHILWYQRAVVSYDVPVAAEGRVYALTQGFPTRNDFAKFLCFDELTGEKIYETEHKEFLAYRPSRPTVYEDHVFFGSDGGFVFAFRLSDGELVWCHRTTGQTWQPAVFENRVYVTSDDGNLLVFEGKKSPTKKEAIQEHG